jgi:hypothetical protein
MRICLIAEDIMMFAVQEIAMLALLYYVRPMRI